MDYYKTIQTAEIEGVYFEHDYIYWSIFVMLERLSLSLTVV
mgnify:CR=1 FL=1